MVNTIGLKVIYGFDFLGELITLFLETIYASLTPPYRIKDIFKQIYFVANQSLFIIVFCVCFAAAVTIIEASFHMKIVIQNDSMVPGFAALLILRELGAVVSALLLTSRVGAGLAAESATMKITEQIDAYKMLNMDPIKYIVAPRFVACIIGGGILSIVANVICLYGAMIVSTIKLGHTSGSFMASVMVFVKFRDLMFAAIKGVCFGATIPIFSCFYGFRCKEGAEGVGLATTNSVVATSVAILIIDFILSYIFSFFY